MKWGVRKQQTKNPNYSETQRDRDRRVYSKGAEKRINKAMNEGSSISPARSKEANRIAKVRRRSVVTGQVGAVIGGAGGAVAGYKVANYVTDKYGMNLVPELSGAVKGSITIGSSKIATQIGRYGGQSLGMISGGYNPNKFRY